MDADGLIATNFHVVSQYVHESDKYRLEYVDDAGATGALTLVDFDVVHDLALVKREPAAEAAGAFLRLHDGDLAQGESLYALGNPLDLGQAIVPGAFNGLVQVSFYRKLLFTGSLNPGMSGGPTLNAAGRVVGVNVSTAGNQISFLVPVSHLESLRVHAGEPLEPRAYRARIEEQLVADQERKYAALLAEPWETQPLGNSAVVAAPEAFFKCWGDTLDDDDTRYRVTESFCMSQDDIYVSRRLSTGLIDFQFATITSDELGSLPFHRLYGERFNYMSTRSRAGEDEVTNYQCHRDFVADDNAGGAWRNVLCARQYKNYAGLFDVLFLGQYLGGDREGLCTHVALSGVTRENAQAFLRQFMATNAWRS